jgi:uncharacterized coiled-coil DUF342 family protein
MDLSNDNVNNTKTKQFTEKLQTLQSQLPSILEDFKKYYVFYNKNPEYPEYQQLFQNIKGNLNSVNAELFTLSNDVQSNTDKLNDNFSNIDTLIKTAKEKNTRLKKALGIVEHKNNAASEMITDYKKMYDNGYLRNWALFFSILVLGAGIAKVYKKPAANVIPVVK